MHSLPQRRSPRLKEYDYRQEGAYFVTICTHNRMHLFGEIVDGEMVLNEVGTISKACWEEIPSHFQNVEIDAAVVMPNHVHGIVLIVDRVGEKMNGHDNVVSLQAGREAFGEPLKGSLAAIMRAYKAAVTYQIMKTCPDAAMPIWQGRYHDHIIRNQKALEMIREYVVNNPARWAKDMLYSG